jgi:hypothetical protein
MFGVGTQTYSAKPKSGRIPGDMFSGGSTGTDMFSGGGGAGVDMFGGP